MLTPRSGSIRSVLYNTSHFSFNCRGKTSKPNLSQAATVQTNSSYKNQDFPLSNPPTPLPISISACLTPMAWTAPPTSKLILPSPSSPRSNILPFKTTGRRTPPYTRANVHASSWTSSQLISATISATLEVGRQCAELLTSLSLLRSPSAKR